MLFALIVQLTVLVVAARTVNPVTIPTIPKIQIIAISDFIEFYFITR